MRDINGLVQYRRDELAYKIVHIHQIYLHNEKVVFMYTWSEIFGQNE